MNLADAIEYIRPSIVQIAVLPSAAAHGAQFNVLGTGFWVSENGLVITARHVIEDARRLIASFPGSRLMIGQSIPSVTDPEFTIRGTFNYLESEVVEGKHSSLKERAGVKRGFGLRFRGRGVFAGHAEVASWLCLSPRRCRVRASGRPGQGPGGARPRSRRRRRP